MKVVHTVFIIFAFLNYIIILHVYPQLGWLVRSKIKITEFLKGNDRFAKTIVFCIDIEHAEGMRTALANANADLVAEKDEAAEHGQVLNAKHLRH